MSDDEFSDPKGANSRWHRMDVKKVLNSNEGGVFRWKRATTSEIPNAKVVKHQKKPKVETEIETDVEVIEITDDESAENISEENIKEISHLNFPLQDKANVDNSSIITCESDNENSHVEEIPAESKSILYNRFLRKKLRDELPSPPGMPPIIAGVPVKFPITPYKSQISVMNAIIKGCKNEEHCLLESPTGSGKTLALLCAALAWQKHYKETSIACTPSKNHDPGSATGSCQMDNSMNCDFNAWNEQIGNMNKNENKFGMKAAYPKIFYGSRTHKQIEQVIREFKKTYYRDNPMTILSSREHTCIQDAKKGVSKTQLCNDLRDPMNKLGCCYYKETNKDDISSNIKLSLAGFDTPWDIEDLVTFGKEKRACPYFAARALMAEADIIFCPYNYLIDPFIRESMGIDLRGHVVIVDEAHNIEGICRDVASANFREDHLQEAIDDCQLVFNFLKAPTYETLAQYLRDLLQLIRDQYLPETFNIYEEVNSDCWTGEETWTLLSMNQLGDERYKAFNMACRNAITEYNQVKEDLKMGKHQEDEEDGEDGEDGESQDAKGDKKKKKKKTPMSINFNTKRLLEQLQMALECIKDVVHQKDYRCTITMGYHADAKVKLKEDTWVTPSNSSKRLRMLKFMCMNSAIIFQQVAGNARSFILASGTLSPTSTFESELGTKFVHKLHANHVIPREQVYIRGIGSGPTGTALKATYHNVQTLPFKDDLGRLIINVCQTIPHGILCFFSSYSMMTSQIERWQETGMWSELERCKHVLQEPRSNNNLDEVMTEYRQVIKETGERPAGGITGALLFAVFRGKVAEGIDFSDNEARCVFTIGIPYAVQNDPVVKLKREYNDRNRDKGLLSGSEWYSVQAYRALNQALGRCIRHRNDWGAVLLVDERLLSPYCANYLPKWVREMRLEGSRFDLKQELKTFVERQQLRDKERALD